jgi:hypothetical protein
MRNGTCPKCGSTDVYCGADLYTWTKAGAYWANSIPVTPWAYAPLDNYVCTACGYVESYIANRSKLMKIKQKWPRVDQTGRGFDPLGSKRGTAARACPNCGRSLQEDWRACPYCGQPMV